MRVLILFVVALLVAIAAPVAATPVQYFSLAGFQSAVPTSILTSFTPPGEIHAQDVVFDGTIFHVNTCFIGGNCWGVSPINSLESNDITPELYFWNGSNYVD